MTIPLGTLLRHYKRADIQEAMIGCAEDREVAVKYGDKGFGKRPDTLRNMRDVIEFAKNGATSFHCSEELWTNPLLLETGKRKEEIDTLRKGWDLILDIDCKELRYSQIAGDLLVQALRYHDIENVTVKFSGNHGFHIAVPSSSFPEEVQGIPISTLFPEGPRRIAGYLKEMIRPHLASRLLESENDVATISKNSGIDMDKLMANGRFDPFEALAIDTILLSSRHLYRMPYSFNEKSGLVSIPIDPSKILEFERGSAEAESVHTNKHGFLTSKPGSVGEARKLIIQAFDFKLPEEKIAAATPKNVIERIGGGTRKEFEEPQFALQEELFPPCIKTILSGMGDGKKRAAFVLVNFLRSAGWQQDKIEERLREWNKNNTPEMLREQDMIAPLRYHGSKKKSLPPNCENKQYYVDVAICKPDNLCRYIKNPAQYSLRKARAMAENSDKKKLPKDPEAKKKRPEQNRANAQAPAQDERSPAENKIRIEPPEGQSL